MNTSGFFLENTFIIWYVIYNALFFWLQQSAYSSISYIEQHLNGRLQTAKNVLQVLQRIDIWTRKMQKLLRSQLFIFLNDISWVSNCERNWTDSLFTLYHSFGWHHCFWNFLIPTVFPTQWKLYCFLLISVIKNAKSLEKKQFMKNNARFTELRLSGIQWGEKH